MTTTTAAVTPGEHTGATPGEHTAAAHSALRARGSEAVMRAPVDIYENGDGLVLEADMPGVSRDRLTVRVDGETLVLEGSVQFELPERSEALYADVRAPLYRRNFVLGRELDADKIQAQLKDGVLKVSIPKRAELRPRKIEVQGG